MNSSASSPLAIENLFGLAGKTAVVTGGSRGIGFMIASGLVANGVKTYITARNAEPCDDAAARLSEIGDCVSVPADLSTAEGLGTGVTVSSDGEFVDRAVVRRAQAIIADVRERP